MHSKVLGSTGDVSQLRLHVYTNEHEPETKLSKNEYESGTFESGRVCGTLYS